MSESKYILYLVVDLVSNYPRLRIVTSLPSHICCCQTRAAPTLTIDPSTSTYLHISTICTSKYISTIHRVSHNIGPTFRFAILSASTLPNTKVGWVIKNSGNLLHDRILKIDFQIENSGDKWGQSCHPSFRNWHFAITQSQKKKILCYRYQLWPQLSHLFLKQFSKFVAIM